MEQFYYIVQEPETVLLYNKTKKTIHFLRVLLAELGKLDDFFKINYKTKLIFKEKINFFE